MSTRQDYSEQDFPLSERFWYYHIIFLVEDFALFSHVSAMPSGSSLSVGVILRLNGQQDLFVRNNNPLARVCVVTELFGQGKFFQVEWFDNGARREVGGTIPPVAIELLSNFFGHESSISGSFDWWSSWSWNKFKFALQWKDSKVVQFICWCCVFDGTVSYFQHLIYHAISLHCWSYNSLSLAVCHWYSFGSE